MKTNLLLLLLVLLLAHCMKSQGDKLSKDQLEAVALMTSSYEKAERYNDSLISARNGMINADSARVHYFDSEYHYYDLKFDSCHHAYQHNLTSANHSHTNNSLQMHDQSSGMMGNCKCCANGGHDVSLHQRLTDLHNLHVIYHPH